ncbi:MAG: pitrilysin family protein, partial [Bacteroidales bacterium]
MKKLFLLILVGAMGLQVFGQGPLPIDPKTVKGTLPNGLTYYIRANAEPKGQAEFFIAQKVGSMQELENQRGLAHFLEHMAFNGTKNFPGKALFTFTEGIGVKFGYNLNAGTSWDETVYNISAVPVSRKGIVDSCLLVLHDWSNALTLLDKDINEERGVIREEMRTRDDADMRMLEKMLTLIFPNNRYSERFVIGTKEVIENFKPQELRDYYHRWYRPDHQAIIIIGDIDPVYVESKIKTMFSDIAKPSTPSELVAVPIADNATPIVGFITDPEATNSTISINYKQEALPKELKLSAQSLVLNYVKGV